MYMEAFNEIIVFLVKEAAVCIRNTLNYRMAEISMLVCKLAVYCILGIIHGRKHLRILWILK